MSRYKLARPRYKLVSRACQSGAAGRALEQVGAKPLLEMADPLAQRRLLDAQRLGRLAKTPKLRRRYDIMEVTDFDHAPALAALVLQTNPMFRGSLMLKIPRNGGKTIRRGSSYQWQICDCGNVGIDLDQCRRQSGRDRVAVVYVQALLKTAAHDPNSCLTARSRPASEIGCLIPVSIVSEDHYAWGSKVGRD